jgi:hypothetical protein
MKRRLLAIAGLAVVLGACAQHSKSETATPTTASTTTTTTAPETPEAAFLADVQGAGFGSVDMEDPANTDPLLDIAKRNICGLFDSGASYGDVAQALIDTGRHPTGEQVKTFIRSAVENFCPRNTASLPA